MKHLSKLILLLLVAGFTASAQDGKKMTFQGSLFQADQPFNGTAELGFTISLDSANSWTETISDVNVVNGLYSIVLGETTPLPEDLFYDANERVMSVTVDGVALGNVMLYAPFAPGLPDVIDVDTLYAYALGIGTDSIDNAYISSNGDGYFAGDLLVEGEINSASEFNTALNDSTGVHLSADGSGILTGNLDVGSLTVKGEPFKPEVTLPLDLSGPNGNRSVMLSSEGENGNDGTFRLADSLGRSRVTLFANKFNADSLGNRTYTGAGGAWFGGANGFMGANISSDGPENSNGFLELGDKSGIPQARLFINESAEGVTSGALSLRGSDGSEFHVNSNGIDFGNTFQIGDNADGTYTQQRNDAFRVKNDNDQFSSVFLNRFNNGQARLQLSSHDEAGTNQGIAYLGANAEGGYSYIGSADPNNNLRAGMYVSNNLPHLFMQGTFDVQGDINADSLGNLTDTTYYRPEYVNLDVHHNDDGDEYGALTLRGSDGSEFHVSSHGIEGMNTRSKKFELENDENDRLVGDMTSNSNGGQLNIGGIIDTSDTTYSYGGGISTGTKFWESTPQLGYFHLRGSVNEANYFGANLKFTLEAVARENSEEAEFKMYGSNLDGNSSAKVVLQMNSALDQSGQSAAEITGDGPNSPNFFLGAKTWEDNGANRAYFRMNGANAVSYMNDNGTPDSISDDFEEFYHPDLVLLDIHDHGDGNESGNITLRSTDGKELHIGPYGIEGLESGFQNKEFVIQHEYSDEQVGNIAGLQNGSQINLGGLLDTSDTTTSYGGGLSAGTKFWEGNPQLGYVHLRGTVNEANYFDANMKFAMEAVNHGDWEGAEFKMFGNDLDENSAAKAVLLIESVLDPQGSSAAHINGEGSSSPNFALGAKSWEDNGANRPYMRMNGGDEVFWYDDKGTPEDSTDDESGNYHPDLVWMDITKWENGTELGGVTFRATDGAEFGINAYGFTSALNDVNVNNSIVLGDFYGSGTGIEMNGDGHINASGALSAGYFDISGPNTPNIAMGSKDWENADLGYMVIRGSTSDLNEAGDTVHPDLLWLEAQAQEDGVQFGSINLMSTGGNTANMSANGLSADSDGMNLNVTASEVSMWVENGQYANLGIGVDDGSPNTNNGGVLNLGGASGTTGIRAYGEFIDGDGNSVSHVALDHDSTGYVYLWGSGTVDASSSMNAPAFNQTSDARFKKDVKSVEGALAKVQKLNGYTYFWNRTAKQVKGINDESEQIGVIAQELEEIFPQLVNTDENGYKSVNYASMTAVLIEAVKELNAKVENLETENSGLKAKVEANANLESRLAQIEKLLGVKTNETTSANNK